MKKLLVILTCLMVCCCIAIKPIKANAESLTGTYTYADDGVCTFNFVDDANCDCVLDKNGTIINFSCTYTYTNGILKIYILGEELWQFSVNEDNTLTYIEDVIEPIEAENSEDVEWLSNIKNWIITAVASVLGSATVCMIFKWVLGKIYEKLKVLIADIIDKKKELKENGEEMQKIINSLIAENEEQQKLLKERQDAFIEQVGNAIVLLASGNSEMVANGTAESIKEAFKNESVQEK